MMYSEGTSHRLVSVLWLCTVTIPTCFGTYYPVSYSLMKNPGLVISLNTGRDAVVRTTSQLISPSSSVSIQVQAPTTPSGQYLVARFFSYNQPNQDDQDTCNIEGVHLKANGKDMIGGYQGWCRRSRPSDQYTLGQLASIGIQTHSGTVLRSISFDVLFSVVLNKTASPGDMCPTGWFDCNYRNQCVRDELKCNGYNDCGNSQDEIEGCGVSRDLVVGLAVGLTLGVVIGVVVVVFLLLRRRRRLRYIRYQ